jgi:hypothetical protein
MTSPDHLWLSGDGQTFVCERDECAGHSLATAIRDDDKGRAVTDTDGERYHRMNDTDLSELAPLAEALGQVIECKGHHISWDTRTKRLVRSE